MTTWGLVATVKAPEEQLLAYVAHHQSLGAQNIRLYFDDPADPALRRLSRVPGVTTIRCTDWYWALRGGRPDKLHNRQIKNARHAQLRCRLDWLGHLDVDEFLHSQRPVAAILAEVPREVPNVLIDSFEAMHDPDLPDDIFTARQFRAALRDQHHGLLDPIFGFAAPLLAKGNLSHTIGKSFCRIAARDVKLGLHEVFRDKTPIAQPFHPELRLLHFHAQDRAAWLEALPFRLRNGAYHFPAEQALREHLLAADAVGLAAFYEIAMTLTPDKAALLDQHGLLVTADLALRAKVARLLAA
jgi:hypothetical protein